MCRKKKERKKEHDVEEKGENARKCCCLHLPDYALENASTEPVLLLLAGLLGSRMLLLLLPCISYCRNEHSMN